MLTGRINKIQRDSTILYYDTTAHKKRLYKLPIMFFKLCIVAVPRVPVSHSLPLGRRTFSIKIHGGKKNGQLPKTDQQQAWAGSLASPSDSIILILDQMIYLHQTSLPSTPRHQACWAPSHNSPDQLSRCPRSERTSGPVSARYQHPTTSTSRQSGSWYKS